MIKKHTFISFDFDHDEDLRNLLVGQSRNPDSPFEIADHSLRFHLTGDWESKIRSRIKRTECVIVLCGNHTSTADGVSIELEIAKEEGIPYFLLSGRKGGTNKKPRIATSSDSMYQWNWENLKKLINGER